MKIAVACDHAGFPLKLSILETLLAAGYEVLDLGTDSVEPVDYPDYAERLGHLIQSGEIERGVLLCGSGVGACIAANKMQGVYACRLPRYIFCPPGRGARRYECVVHRYPCRRPGID